MHGRAMDVCDRRGSARFVTSMENFLRTMAVLFGCIALPTMGLTAPRLPQSPFPVSQQPERVVVFDLAGASWDTRLLALSAAGLVATRSPELAVVDSGDGVPPDGSTSSGGFAGWHLRLLPVVLEWGLKVSSRL